MATALSSRKRWCELSQSEKLSRWLAHQRYVRNAERRYSGTHWLETITAARFEGHDQMGNPKWVYRLKYVGWGPRWNRWEQERSIVVEESQLDIGRPQIVNAFWGSMSKEDRQRISLMKINDIILPGPGFIEERQGVVQSILRLPEYQGYRDELGHAESETEMSDLEVNEPQLFDVLKKTTRKRPKKYKGRAHTRKAQPTFKVKKFTLRNEQPAGVPPIRSRMANQKQQESEQETQDSAGQTSYPPRVFQGAQQRSSLISVGSNLDLSSSASELGQGAHRQRPMFKRTIPERDYFIGPSQNPKGSTIFEEPQYADVGEYPMINRTYERMQKALAAPMRSELYLEDDQQLPMCTEEPMEASGSEMLDYLKFGDEDVEMGTSEDNTDDRPSGHNSDPPARSPRTILEPNQIVVSVLGATGSVISVVLSLLDLAICDDFGDLVQSIKQRPYLSLEGPYDDADLNVDGWQMQDAVFGIETSDGGVIQEALLALEGPKFYKLCDGIDATGFVLFNPARGPAWFIVPEEAQDCDLVLWKV